jgi:hypothetical protein
MGEVASIFAGEVQLLQREGQGDFVCKFDELFNMQGVHSECVIKPSLDAPGDTLGTN